MTIYSIHFVLNKYFNVKDYFTQYIHKFKYFAHKQTLKIKRISKF